MYSFVEHLLGGLLVLHWIYIKYKLKIQIFSYLVHKTCCYIDVGERRKVQIFAIDRYLRLAGPEKSEKLARAALGLEGAFNFGICIKNST